MGRKKLTLPMSQIISEYESGMTSYQLGEKYGCTHPTIINRLRDHGVEIMVMGGRGKKLTLPMDQIISDYESGMGCERLGGKYGVSPSTIWSRLRDHGVEIRNRGIKKADLPMSQIISEYESGMGSYQLGEKYGVSEFTIRRRLREEGVEVRIFGKLDLPISQIISEYKLGMTSVKLGEKYGVSPYTILSRLRENGVKTRGRHSQ